MFWYSSSVRQKLIVLPKLLCKRRQENITNSIRSKTKKAFSFEKNNHPHLIDIELLFMDTLLSFSPKNMNMEKRINDALGDGYHYEYGVVHNLTGSFGVTFETMVDGKSWLKKIPRDSRDDFRAEYDFAYKAFEAGGERFVPKVLGYNKQDGSYLQEVATESLETYIYNDVSLSDKAKKEIVIQIVNAIAHIHSRGIIHRDLHPGNVFGFKEDDSSINWKISDFGLSYDFDNKQSCLKEKEGCRGDNNYNSPEQRERLDSATYQSDIYSIGRLISFIFNKNPSNSNHAFKDISEKCCSKNPNERYGRVTLLLDDINKIVL